MATSIFRPPKTLIPPFPGSDQVSSVDEQMDQLGQAPMDYAGIVEYNNRAQALQAAIDRDFQQSSAREAMGFEAEQAELNRLFQQSSAREAMTFEAEQARINREFQLDMSNTSYQRARADMEKAGINPILAYTQGGASTTNGAVASGQSASGSSARGQSASGSRASVDTSTTREILNQLISSGASVFNTYLKGGFNLIGKFTKLLPFL